MELSIDEARAPIEAYFRSSVGLGRPAVATLSSLIDLLWRMPSDSGDLGRELPELELVPVPDNNRFSDLHWQLAYRLLDLREIVRPLSDLLAEAAELDEDLPALVGLLAAHAYAPELASAMRRGQERVLLAVPAGSPLPPMGVGGLHGDDLLISSIALVDDEAAQ